MCLLVFMCTMSWCLRRPVVEDIKSPGIDLKVVVSHYVVPETKPGSSAVRTVNY